MTKELTSGEKTTSNFKELFDELFSKNVNDKTEKKNGLTYLSWSYAVQEFTKADPNWKYEIQTFYNHDKQTLVPYMSDVTGLMVATNITSKGIKKGMWLPVMDYANNAMKLEPYQKGSKKVEAATMFDVNKAIMRCLVKNMAMFGLGLYIYAGEDLPEESEASKEETKKALIEAINKSESKEVLGVIYNKNKKMICSNPDLLELITQKGKSFGE